MAKLIYIADDEEHIRSLMKAFLENEGYEVKAFSDGYSVRKAVEEKMPDLLILDIMMPGEDGLSVCSSIRKKSPVPIIIVSAKDSPIDRVTGIMLGSDDYIVKPFLPLELTARVKALFRRVELSSGKEENDENQLQSYRCGNLNLDVPSRKVWIEDRLFPVTPMEFDFLLYLLERKGTAVSKEELLKHVWKLEGNKGDGRMTDDLVKRLRKKMKEKEAAVIIETVWGYGYCLTEKQSGRPL